MAKEMDKNKAVVWIAGIFTYGILTLVRTVYSDGKPLVNLDLNVPKKPETPQA